MTFDHAVLAAIFLQPLLFARVSTSIPADEVGRAVGRMARALVCEQVSAAQWRAKAACTA